MKSFRYRSTCEEVSCAAREVCSLTRVRMVFLFFYSASLKRRRVPPWFFHFMMIYYFVTRKFSGLSNSAYRSPRWVLCIADNNSERLRNSVANTIEIPTEIRFYFNRISPVPAFQLKNWQKGRHVCAWYIFFSGNSIPYLYMVYHGGGVSSSAADFFHWLPVAPW